MPDCDQRQIASLRDAIGSASQWERLAPYLADSLATVADPEALLGRLQRIVHRLRGSAAAIDALTGRELQFLFRLLLPSPFLSRILVADPPLLKELADPVGISRFRSRDDFRDELASALGDGDRDEVFRTHRRALTRIAACDVFNLLDFRTVTRQLSLLADATVQVLMGWIGLSEECVVVALGKLGGEELNYSSDIDLLIVSEAPSPQAAAKVARLLAELDSPERPFYRVDMRLRPWGGAGQLICSPESLVRYFEGPAALWERQSFLKAREIAGQLPLGRVTIERVRAVSVPPASEGTLRDVLKQREAMLAATDPERDLKNGRGSIRDIEFLVQGLQLKHGREQPEVLAAGTGDALVRLASAHLIDAEEYRTLADGYVFLRVVEHMLQLRQNLQTHELPDVDADEVALARRLDFPDAAAFRHHLGLHREAIERLTARRFGRPVTTATPLVATFTDDLARQLESAIVASEEGAPVLLHRTVGREVDLAAAIAGETIHLRHLFQRLSRRGVAIASGHVDRSGDPPIYRVILRGTAIDDAGLDSLPGEFGDPLDDDESDISRRLGCPSGGQSLMPVAISVARQPQQLAITIAAADRSGFLSELLFAFEVAGLRIESIDIETQDERICDRFVVTGATSNGRSLIDDPGRDPELRATIVLAKQFAELLPRSPDPNRAFRNFREFLRGLFRRADWVRDLAALQQSETLQALANVLGMSDFLWYDFIRSQHENLFPVLSEVDRLQQASSRTELREELNAELRDVDDWPAALNRFKDRAMLRADIRHILGLERTFGRFSEELTNIAELVVTTALDRRAAERGMTDPRYAVCALGKCGGREMGFASDIELLVVHDDAMPRSEAASLHSAVESLPQTIVTKSAGIFELDFRLRPHGNAGPLACSLASFVSYFAPEGDAWPFERQALVKLRTISGPKELRERIVAARDAMIFRPGTVDLAALRAIREQQIRQKVGQTVNAKLSRGALVDIEYFVQALCLHHGRDERSLREPNTRRALRALTKAGIISDPERLDLRNAYRFFRQLIDALRMVRGDARDLKVPPRGSDAFRFLCRRMERLKPIDDDTEITRLDDDASDLVAAAEDRILQKIAHHLQTVQELTATLPARLSPPTPVDR